MIRWQDITQTMPWRLMMTIYEDDDGVGEVRRVGFVR